MTSSSLSLLVESARDDYRRVFGGAPTWIVAAPGRVNLIGEHTDYNDGFVFPMAIERFTVLAAGPLAAGPLAAGPRRGDAATTKDAAIVRSAHLDAMATIRLDGSARPTDEVVWSSYVQGVAQFAVEAGLQVAPFDAVVHTNVPLGGGLSSSAALEVATATLFETMSGRRLEPVEKALLCQKAEHQFAKMPCGIMDQFVSAMAESGMAMLLDCRTRTPKMVPLADPSVAVLIINSNVKHELTGSEYPTRRWQCEAAARLLGEPMLRDVTTTMLTERRSVFESESDGETCFRRARHIVTENDRTLAMASALNHRDWKRCGELMRASHTSMRDDFEISCPEIDTLVDLACNTSGVWGSRMTGGGFGGCTVSLVESARAESIAAAIATAYEKATGIVPAAFVTHAAHGAKVIATNSDA